MRAAGLGWPAFGALAPVWVAVPFEPGEPEAEAELGLEAFRSWAMRGYFESV